MVNASTVVELGDEGSGDTAGTEESSAAVAEYQVKLAGMLGHGASLDELGEAHVLQRWRRKSPNYAQSSRAREGPRPLAAVALKVGYGRRA